MNNARDRHDQHYGKSTLSSFFTHFSRDCGINPLVEHNGHYNCHHRKSNETRSSRPDMEDSKVIS